ncbi:MAG: NAD(P)H-hydrate epimerase, partial [Clostridia bacterium]|nr:NAD(P)H-hydrate epimerase [Clostridia bacterium]
MLDIVSCESMRKSDLATIEGGVPGVTLMWRAGMGIYESVRWHGRVGIVCGSGNNAGDGYALALILKENNIDATLILLKNKFSADGEYYYKRCQNVSIKTIFYNEDTPLDFDIIVDCILGTGFSGELSPEICEVIEKINSSDAYVVSADINSGLNGDNGLCKIAVKSDITVSIGTRKTGHYLAMAQDYIKKLVNVDIGIEIIEPPYHLIEKADIKKCFKERKHFSNKGTYGYTALIGGCMEYSGAVKLASLALSSLKVGAGVSKLATSRSICPTIMPSLLEVTLYPLDDQNGYIIITNLQDYSNETLKHNYFEKNFHIDGPNRINSTLYERADNYNFTTVSGAFDGFTEGTNYKYTVGSRLDGTSVIIEIMLYEVDGETTTLIYSAKHDTGKTETEIEGLGSNLIAYGCVKGNYENTTFSYSDVYANPYDNEKIKIEGGIINQDGSVSLSAGRHPAGYQTQNGYLAEESGWKSGVSRYVNNYVAFKNQSKVGNYIDFIFTGNNMPLVTLFADSMSNSMGGSSTGNDTTLDQNGYIIATDLHDNTYELLDLSKPREVVVWCKDILRVWGPNRISGISPYQDAAQTTNLATILGEYAGLEDGTQYKYTVGSKLDTDETVLIEVFLYEGTTLKYHATFDTGKTKGETEALGSYIIAYAGVRGNVATTFSYSDVYNPYDNEKIKIEGGSINGDGSITLNYGDHPYAGAKDDGSMYGDGSANQITQYKNNYIAFKDVSKVGNYMDFYFTGKNIPYVTLFADKISQSMGRNSTGLAENVS